MSEQTLPNSVPGFYPVSSRLYFLESFEIQVFPDGIKALFEALGGLTDKSPKSLVRMFGPNGNPQTRNLFEIIRCLQVHEGLRFTVRSIR